MTAAIDTTRGNAWKFATIDTKIFTAIANDHKVDIRVRLFCHACTRLTPFGQSVFERGELEALLDAKPSRHINRAVEAGLLLPGSTTRCLLVPSALAYTKIKYQVSKRAPVRYVFVSARCGEILPDAVIAGIPLWFAIGWWSVWQSSCRSLNEVILERTALQWLFSKSLDLSTGELASFTLRAIERAITEAAERALLHGESKPTRLLLHRCPPHRA